MVIRATVFTRDMQVLSRIEIPNIDQEFNTLGKPVAELVATVNNVSKSEARRLISGGGVMINGVKVVDPTARLTREQGENQWEFILYELINKEQK